MRGGEVSRGDRGEGSIEAKREGEAGAARGEAVGGSRDDTPAGDPSVPRRYPGVIPGRGGGGAPRAAGMRRMRTEPHWPVSLMGTVWGRPILAPQ